MFLFKLVICFFLLNISPAFLVPAKDISAERPVDPKGTGAILPEVVRAHNRNALDSPVFRAGAAFRIITPNPLLPVSGGIGRPHPASIKKGELYVRALVFEKGDTRIAIVSVDNLGWSSVLGNRSRALIKGIAPENILIGATHTHSAPDAYAFPDENV